MTADNTMRPTRRDQITLTEASGSAQTNTTVVTGATGFVGGELIKHLLLTSDRTLVCPVRADSIEHAQHRGADRLAELLGADAVAFGHRVTWLRGDLEEARLGWSMATWNRIAETCTEIFHCAASITFDLPLAEAHRINVDGTRRIHELAVAAAARHTFRRFHHVSTAYVSGLKAGRVDAHHLPADRAANFRNTYERTKARAERWLRSVASVDVPVTIHRPSIVAGSTRTGETSNWNVLYVPMKMVARGMLPVFSAGRTQHVDAIGVDFVVEAMAVFAETDTEVLAAHHLTAGPSVLDVDHVISGTTAAAQAAAMTPSVTKMLSTHQWSLLVAAINLGARLPKRAGKVARRARVMQRGLRGCSVYIPYTRVETIFEATEDHRLLADYGVTMPPAAVYFDRIVRYALAADFGKKSVDVTEATASPALTTPTAPASGLVAA